MILFDILTHGIFISAVAGVVLCQLWKIIAKIVKEKKLDWRLTYASGGMPSSHSTLVAALSISVGLSEGFTSIAFLIALFFSAVVIRDAIGVRRIVDDLIARVNMLVGDNKNGSLGKIDKIAGHTPLQAFVGALIGIVSASAVYALGIV